MIISVYILIACMWGDTWTCTSYILPDKRRKEKENLKKIKRRKRKTEREFIIDFFSAKRL
jgi:hypothetical protein